MMSILLEQGGHFATEPIEKLVEIILNVRSITVANFIFSLLEYGLLICFAKTIYIVMIIQELVMLSHKASLSLTASLLEHI